MGGKGFVVPGFGNGNGKGESMEKGEGKGKDEGKGKGESMEKGEGKDEDKGKGESMEIGEEDGTELSVWAELRKKWGGVIHDSKFELNFETLYDQWIELETGLMNLFNGTDETAALKKGDLDMLGEMIFQFTSLTQEAVNGFEVLGKEVLDWEGKVRTINKKATDIVARQQAEMAKTEKEMNKMREELRRKEKEIEKLKEQIRSRDKGMVCSPKPAMVERGTSPQGDSSEGIRALVKECVREEFERSGVRKEAVQRDRIGQENREKDRRYVEATANTPCREVRLPSIPAVITVRGNNRSYADVLGVLRKEVPREQLGTDRVDVRVTPSGVARITLQGVNRDTARRVATSFREVLGEGASVACPCPMGLIEIAGFDLSIRESELAASIQQEWGVLPADVRVGKVGRTRGGAGRTLVRLPLSVARRMCREGLHVGWGRARVYEVGPRRIQCFRCLGFGHTQARCVATVVASEHPVCYVCAKPGHPASQCGATPTCAACGLRGWATSHRMGSPQCQTLAAYTPRQPGGAGEEMPVQGTGVAEFTRPPEPRKRQRDEAALSSQEGGSSETPPAKTIAKTPLPVGGPKSGLPPEGLDPGEESSQMDVVED